MNIINIVNIKRNAFSLIEVLVSMAIVSAILAASLPIATRMLQKTTNIDSNIAQCIEANTSAGWYNEVNGDITHASLAGVCLQAVADAQYNRRNSLTTVKWFADNGTAAQQTMGKKILRAACDVGGEKACKYFINDCTESDTNCDRADFLDLTYYLDQTRTSTNLGAIYIQNQLRDEYLPRMLENLETGVSSACSGENIACDLTAPRRYIESCNIGNTDACNDAFDNGYNKSCTQILTNWPDAPSGTYRLSYNNTGGTEDVYCYMISMASAAVSGCNQTSTNLQLTTDDDCTYGRTNNYNQTCDEIFANWHTTPYELFNITEHDLITEDVRCMQFPDAESSENVGWDIPADPSCGVTEFLDAETGLGYDYKVSNCNIAVDPIPSDNVDYGCDPATEACCWYANDISCDTTGCGTEVTPGNYDKYVCNHIGAIAACHALNGDNPGQFDPEGETGCADGECTYLSKGWRLPTNDEINFWRTDPATDSVLTAKGQTLGLCDLNSSGTATYCPNHNGCENAFGWGSECSPATVWTSYQNPSEPTKYGNNWLEYNKWKHDNLDPLDFAASTRCVRTFDSATE